LKILERIRAAVRTENYRVSAHANEEMSEDGLSMLDVENAVLTGSLSRRFTKDPRGPRYEVAGSALDGRRIGVVCRFLPSGVLRILTVYAIENGGG
jgi:hypothetical protein